MVEKKRGIIIRKSKTQHLNNQMSSFLFLPRPGGRFRDADSDPVQVPDQVTEVNQAQSTAIVLFGEGTTQQKGLTQCTWKEFDKEQVNKVNLEEEDPTV